jgi:hypothetical protein
VKVDAIQAIAQTAKALLRLLEGNTADYAVHLVAQREQVLREITSILAGNSGNQRLL